MTGGRATTRTGWGFDAHRFGGEPPLLLAGVEVSGSIGVAATSDGDVLAHAVSDAILGAAALGDMGDWFPSDDPVYQGADSMALLRRVIEAALDAGWRPVFADVTVIAQEVRVAPHRAAIRTGLAGALGVPETEVSVKATTTDGLGFIGERRGLASVAVVIVEHVT